MKSAVNVTYKFIIFLAVISIIVSAATLYVDYDSSSIQNNSSHQFSVGVTIKPAKSIPALTKVKDAFAKWFSN